MQAHFKAVINMPIQNDEVPRLRRTVGWGERSREYPAVFERCNFWAGVRNEARELIAFGYICGMGLEHGYLEDVMVAPSHQRCGIGSELVSVLIDEARRRGTEIITVSYDNIHREFYRRAGFEHGGGGVIIFDE